MKERYFGGDRGFTLIELLAVITIIALLAGGLVVSVGFFSRRAMSARTKSIVMRTEQAIHSFYDDYGAYPPEYRDSENAVFFRDRSAANNPFNKAGWEPDYAFDVSDSQFNYSSEILYYFLVRRYDQGNLDYLLKKTSYAEFPEYAVKDVDDDGRMEIVDAWGNPLLYVAKDLYGDDPINESQNVGGNVEPHDDKNENSFSLYSYGIDGLGFYAATKAGEVDYPVQHKSISDDTGMMKEISDKYGTGGVGVKKANRDDVINWKEY